LVAPLGLLREPLFRAGSMCRQRPTEAVAAGVRRAAVRRTKLQEHCKEPQMKHTPHHPTHWLAVAVVVAMALMAFEAYGQQTVHELRINPNAQAVFQGRPAMAGAQAGLGAMSGPPQGGIGLQGSDGAGRNVRRPYVREQQMDPVVSADCANAPRVSGAEKPLCLPEIRDERLERRIAILGIDPQQR
jgi:hypothetical protein